MTGPAEPRHFDALLVGGGVASVRCARTLRRSGFAGSIGLVAEEDTPPYNRPPLSKELLRGDVAEELILAEPVSWYERRGVDLIVGAAATVLDPDAHTIELVDGRRLHFDQLLLATGASARTPPIPGGERALPLRSLDDAVAIRQRAQPASRVVVIGGGFIGVEVAASLAARGSAVVVLESGPALWAAQLGDTVSDWALDHLHRAGVAVRFRASASAIGPSGVHVGDELLPADLVVAGVGVSPRVELATAAGLEVDDGIVVTEEQRTSAAAIFAAGDVARPADGPRVEHWHAAREAGDRAALAMIGAPVPARRAPWVFSEFADATLDVVGWAPRFDELDVRDGVVAYRAAGRVVQVALLDAAVHVPAARELVERRRRVSAAQWGTFATALAPRHRPGR
jgi:3-phenylpropionate/trans-cinnamate dioxygenase ferredoxin reductase component